MPPVWEKDSRISPEGQKDDRGLGRAPDRILSIAVHGQFPVEKVHGHTQGTETDGLNSFTSVVRIYAI